MKIYKYVFYLLIVASGIFACSDDDDAGVINISLNKDQVADEGNSKVINLKDNTTLQLDVHIMPVSAKNKAVVFSSLSTSVVHVSETGLVTPLAIGRDTIEIKALDGSGAYVLYPVNVIDHVVKVSSIIISSSALDVKMEVGTTFDMSDKYTINPSDATDKNVTFTSTDESVIKIDQAGVVTALQEGNAEVVIVATDGSNKEARSKFTIVEKVTGPVDYDRRNWSITVSHPLSPEGGNNRGECILDGDESTFLSMVKPGHEMDDISVSAAEEVCFIIDMKQEQEVDYFRYVHRNSNTALRFLAVTIAGSNDGKNFEMVAQDVDIPDAEVGAIVDPGNVIIPRSAYRYYKVSMTKWLEGVPPGQLKEFYFGYIAE